MSILITFAAKCLCGGGMLYFDYAIIFVLNCNNLNVYEYSIRSTMIDTFIGFLSQIQPPECYMCPLKSWQGISYTHFLTVLLFCIDVQAHT